MQNNLKCFYKDEKHFDKEFTIFIKVPVCVYNII